MKLMVMIRYPLLIMVWGLLAVPCAAQEVLQIGTYGNYPPWTISGSDGTITGFEIDMINDICPRMKAQCTIRAVNFGKLFDDLAAGVYDIYIGGLTATSERLKRVDFSKPYAATSSGFMTTAKCPLAAALSLNQVILDQNEADLPESLRGFLQGLRGFRLAVHVNTVQERFSDLYLKDIVDIRRYTYEEAMYDDMLSGQVDAVMATSWSLYNFVAHNSNRPNPAVLFGPVLSGGLLGSGLAAALRQGDSDRLARLNAALSAAIADGTLARLSLKWFGYNIAPD